MRSLTCNSGGRVALVDISASIVLSDNVTAMRKLVFHFFNALKCAKVGSTSGDTTDNSTCH